MGERQGGHPAVATLGIGALAVEIRDIIAQSVSPGNAAPLATHFEITRITPPLLSKSTTCLATANAEACDPTYYTSVIWPEHDRCSGHGTVQALNTEEVDGKLKLFAILCPNRGLIYWSQAPSISSAPSSSSRTSPTWGTPTCCTSASPMSPTRG